MKKIFYILWLLPLVITACKQDLGSEIASLESQLASANEMDPKLARELIDKYKQQASLLNNETSSTWLFRAGQVANGIKDYTQAILLWEEVLKQYPGSDEAPGALFSQAFTYDYYIKNTDKARQLYQDFIDRYPQDELAAQARVSIENLGKSPEEMLQQITGQSK